MEEHAFTSHGLEYRIRVGFSSEFADEIDPILEFLIPRAHVEETYLVRHVPRARLLAVADSGGSIVAFCALKRANREHASSIARESFYPLELELPELGYAATHEHHRGRGLGKHLSAAILSQTEGAVYATVRFGNIFEEQILRDLHFRQVGETWRRTDDNGTQYFIGLWIRNSSASPKDSDIADRSASGRVCRRS